MKIYLAGYESAGNTFTKEIKESIKNILISYYYCSKVKKFKEWHKEGKKIFIDSGAFTAWSLKKHISIREYISFIRKAEDYVETYAVLDDINSAEKTKENMILMESEGLKPLPCFHYKEKFDYLDYYTSRYNHIALGGMVSRKQDNIDRWLEVIFDKYPSIKFHGFGMTSSITMQKFPWYSVDSTSWKSGEQYARVMTPFGAIAFGEGREPMSDVIRKKYDEYFLSSCGLSFKDLEVSWKNRTTANALYYISLETPYNEKKKFVKLQEELFMGDMNDQSITKRIITPEVEEVILEDKGQLLFSF